MQELNVLSEELVGWLIKLTNNCCYEECNTVSHSRGFFLQVELQTDIFYCSISQTENVSQNVITPTAIMIVD